MLLSKLFLFSPATLAIAFAIHKGGHDKYSLDKDGYHIDAQLVRLEYICSCYE
jgi:hypothetical protein